ncbi:4'-phosphopantetheinyl transferase family protein [Alcanivorax borkumensis]|uniref:Enterobactin synthase component D n=1 Tax=Alcanivorax borkumensis (strain ATCC 700651 / DSM 11573 / NCIMB 13689 / SK2) TaxID=393595 RepID=Q0VNL8_ALCBS|nr:4'-phosphopantetheinyl transferase superfamily protein [Alcanivorax borkumensis]CAL17230.1 siderophore biosynthesis protein, putative [Alcanivorax borkumensis SK2]
MSAIHASYGDVIKPLTQGLSNFFTAGKTVILSGFTGTCYHCRFDAAHYHDALFARYKTPLPATLSNATASRKAEFLAGRIAAHNAFIQLDLRPEIIGIGLRREPQWPPTVLGSISHHGDSAFCMMMPRPAQAPLVSPGIDVEKVISADDRALLSPSILSHEDLEFIHGNFVNIEYGFTVVFSAKEALFKALHPAVGRYFDFLDVKISSIHTERCELELRLVTNLSAQLLNAHTVTVYWRREINTVISWVLPSH